MPGRALQGWRNRADEPWAMRFFFCFGYQSPTQRDGQEIHGWEDEDSCRIAIDARDPGEAEAWGCAIAESFVRRLFMPEPVSWKEMRFAHWVEPAPDVLDSGTLSVKMGEHPDYEAMVRSKMPR
jgi:hypothetical protein